MKATLATLTLLTFVLLLAPLASATTPMRIPPENPIHRGYMPLPRPLGQPFQQPSQLVATGPIRVPPRMLMWPPTTVPVPAKKDGKTRP